MDPIDLGDGWCVREYRDDDLEALVRYGDSAAVAAQVRDRFPHPYTEAAGREWLETVAAEDPATHFAIAAADDRPPADGPAPGGFVGGVGLEPQEDVYRVTAEIGYWLGEPFWGRGIATRAVTALTRWGFETLELERIEARVFATNPASIRVLEKAGFELEGRLRRSAIKSGRVLDSLLYARLRSSEGAHP